MAVVIGVVLVLAVCVGIVLAWGRFGTVGARSSRSIERYEHGLDVLGDLAKRAEASPSARVRVQAPNPPGEPHVQTEAVTKGSPPPRLRPAPNAASAAVPAPRLPLLPPVLPGIEAQDKRGEPTERAGFAARVAPQEDPPTELLPSVVVPAEALVEWRPQARVAGLEPRRAERTSRRGPVAPPPPIAASVEPGVLPVFSEEAIGPIAPPSAGTADERPQVDHPAASISSARRHYGRRRAVTTIAAAVVVAGVIVGVTRLDAKSASPPTKTAGGSVPALHHHRTAAGTSTSAKRSAKNKGKTHHRSSSRSSTPGSSKTAPSPGAPISVTKSAVSYDAPAGPYAVVLTVSGRCWFGVQSPGTAPSGPYRYQDTLDPGASATYAADGPVSIRIGAPPTLLSVTVNGTPLQLPAGYTLPYDLILEPPGLSTS